MKVYIITLHRARNYGSVLQSYALQEYLKKLNLDVRTIDYFPKRYHTWGRIKEIKLKKGVFSFFLVRLLAICILIPSFIKRKIIFDDYVKKNILITPKSVNEEDDLSTMYTDGDIFCTGSDQVWNSYWNGKCDGKLFLDFAGNKRRFSYASSFGKEKLDCDEIENTKKYLKSYYKISVREKSGVQICNSLGLEAIQVLDPTLLFNNVFWENHSYSLPRKKYILTYNLHHDSRINVAAKKLAKSMNLKVINISYNWHDIFEYGKLSWCPSIEKFLGLFKDCEYVISDSFHAVAFSTIFHKKFLVFLPKFAKSRIVSFLNMIDLSYRAVVNCDNIELIDKDIDYKLIDSILTKEKHKATEYIESCLKYEE